MRSNWEGASLPEVVGHTLAAHAAAAGEGRIVISGPPVRLSPASVVTVNFAFHELATNAAKHGALSVPEGRVEIAWTVARAEGGPCTVEILWRERGGPPVRRSERRGFGSRLIESGLAREFGAEVALDFAPEGVKCHIRLPLAAEEGEG
jgi:two-component sensor histidine kinase